MPFQPIGEWCAAHKTNASELFGDGWKKGQLRTGLLYGHFLMLLAALLGVRPKLVNRLDIIESGRFRSAA